jgi:DNA-binding PadR family transcriptional regulator
MEVLAILDKGPSYAAKMLEERPDLVNPTRKHGVIIVDPGALYTKLARLAKRELIERIDNYKLPRDADYSRQVRSRAVWYRLTTKGRELLQEHRRAIRK